MSNRFLVWNESTTDPVILCALDLESTTESSNGNNLSDYPWENDEVPEFPKDGLYVVEFDNDTVDGATTFTNIKVRDLTTDEWSGLRRRENIYW